MRIRYRVAIEDVLAFQHYHCDHSPAVRQQRRVLIWGVPLVTFLLLGLIMLLPTRPLFTFDAELPVVACVAAATLCVLWIVLAPGMLRKGMERNVRRLYGEGANLGTLGPHELEVTDTHLIERNPYGESHRVFQALEKVAFADGYAFIYVSAVSAHIVPGDAIEEGHFQAFLEMLERGIEKAWDSAGTPQRAESILSLPRMKRPSGDS
jgi:hypothetical protein